MEASTAPTVPVLTLDEVVAAWSGRSGVALCVGGFGSPRQERHDRLGLFTLPPDGGEPLLDVWVVTAGLEALAAALPGPVARGGWDTMYATGWEVAWARTEEQVWVWARGRGVRCAVEGRRVTVDGAEVGPVQAVESFLSGDWVRRGVRLRLTQGEVEVARVVKTDAALGGFFYDGLDLLADSGWVHELGRMLAEVLGVPYVDGMG